MRNASPTHDRSAAADASAYPGGRGGYAPGSGRERRFRLMKPGTLHGSASRGNPARSPHPGCFGVRFGRRLGPQTPRGAGVRAGEEVLWGFAYPNGGSGWGAAFGRF
jgi:hypothetical protein